MTVFADQETLSHLPLKDLQMTCLLRAVLPVKNAKTVVDAIDAVTIDDRPKPAPDLFLFAATQLGLEPAHCVVVEDAAAGVEAAIAAGMGTIGLVPVERFGGSAHLVLPNLMGVHLSDLQTQLGRSLADL